ncbi:hypothetical protein L7F22_033189 [Adiantum nelumboides]|nr:hypothetical protein [Adiantum nelumboides]
MSTSIYPLQFDTFSPGNSKHVWNPSLRCRRHIGRLHLGKAKLIAVSCSVSPNLGLEQRALGKTDAKTFDEVQALENDHSNNGALFSAHGWTALRASHDDLDMLKKFCQVQAEAFHVSFPFFDDFFFSVFKGEVLSSLLYKIRHAGPKRFACLVAVPDCLQGEEIKVVGVVDAAAMADRHVLNCLPGVDEYLYISGMAVDTQYSLEELRGVWNTRWDWFHRPIHAVAHLLRPLWRSEEQYENEELEQGLQVYFLTWVAGDVQMLRRLEDDLFLFRNRSHSFGRPTTEFRETQLQPVSWWEKYGSCAPTLKRLAVRILSQDYSLGPCERNWSTWVLFHTKKRNRLSTAQLERLVYCHCNLRLLDHTTTSPEPRQVNVDKIDIEKVKDIPDIPREELDIYTMLFEEMSAPAHQTRASSRRSKSARGDASTSATVLSPSSSGSADEGGGSKTDAAFASASGAGSSSDADAEDADTEEGDQR